MKIPGDKISIRVILPDISYIDNLVISYIAGDKILTCGHCLPKNSKLNIGDIIFTSGFDIPGEEKEIGLIRIKPDFVTNFINKRRFQFGLVSADFCSNLRLSTAGSLQFRVKKY